MRLDEEGAIGRVVMGGCTEIDGAVYLNGENQRQAGAISCAAENADEYAIW